MKQLDAGRHVISGNTEFSHWMSRSIHSELNLALRLQCFQVKFQKHVQSNEAAAASRTHWCRKMAAKQNDILFPETANVLPLRDAVASPDVFKSLDSRSWHLTIFPYNKHRTWLTQMSGKASGMVADIPQTSRLTDFWRGLWVWTLKVILLTQRD